MAAYDPQQQPNPPTPGSASCLSAPALLDRLDEEINRAERLGTPLSCLLVVIGDADELSYAHGSAFVEEALAFIAEALAGELRRFDRIGRPSEEELMLVLPGADAPQGEIAARRVLGRLRAIKIDSEGARRPLRMVVGLATWLKDVTAEQMLAEARAAVQREHLMGPSMTIAGSPPRDVPS
jgi:PleD family two-component response regulator